MSFLQQFVKNVSNAVGESPKIVSKLFFQNGNNV